MLKAVVYTIVTSAFILLLRLFLPIDANTKTYPIHALSRRMGYKIPPPNFDPLVEKLEHLSDEKQLDADEESFFSEGRLNVTLRLMIMFPFLDRAPRDDLIDSKELEAWMVQQTTYQLNSRAQKELEFHDKNGDGVISFSEYLPQFSMADIERNDMEHGQAGWWKELFDNADVDNNGTLNFYEFKDFLHPEDSKNEQIQNWLLRRKIRQLDSDKDQKVSYLEFLNGAYDSYKNYIEFETVGAVKTSAGNIFGKLDVNKDSLLDLEELKPLLRYLCPGELSFAKYYTIYVIQEADENGDRKLSINEMINHDDLFYNTFYEEEDEEDLHDEL